MVKILVCLSQLSKAQLLSIVQNCPTLSIPASKTKNQIVDYLNNELPSSRRLKALIKSFDEKSIEVVRMFLKEKKLRYNGMSQGDFTKFLVYNRRMANSFNDVVTKMLCAGLLFNNVKVGKQQKVVIPSEYLKFFDDYFKINGS